MFLLNRTSFTSQNYLFGNNLGFSLKKKWGSFSSQCGRAFGRKNHHHHHKKKNRITESHHMSKRHDFVHESLNLSNSCMIICWIFRHQNNNNDDNDINNNNDVIGFHNCWKNHWFSLYSSKSSKLLQLQIPVSVIIWYHKCHYKSEHYFSLLLLTALFRLKIILIFSQQRSLIME